jgi:hypothetical protein
MTDDVCIIRASAGDVRAVANFLLEQDVRPAPREADVAALLGRGDATVLCALRDGRVEAVAGCVKDGPASWLVYFAVEEKREDLLAPALIARVQDAAAGAGVLTAQARRESRAYNLLLRCGFEAAWEEGDAADGRVVSVVDLVKVL